jgi:adenylosuccinate synthase
MPISIVVGGQFGSEGKGKVALEIVRRNRGPVTAVRVGGPNSGHTAYDRNGKKWALRQMPAACIDRNVDVIFPAGAYIDVDLLFREIEALDYPRDRVWISEFANIITDQHKKWEAAADLVGTIGSTGSGVGAAVLASVGRGAKNLLLNVIHANDEPRLEQLVSDTTLRLRKSLESRERIVIEGSQGFGLSLIDGGYWPKATARITTAAGALAEAGLSPLDVDDVTMVIRSFPIRVAGNSGQLPGETTWDSIAESIDKGADITEYTTVTNKVRRVGLFDPNIVIRALAANNPTTLVLNHMDYVGSASSLDANCSKVSRFVSKIERQIGHRIHFLGFSPMDLQDVRQFDRSNAYDG